MNLSTLDRPITELANDLMISELVALSAALASEEATLKRRKETLHAINTRRFNEEATKALSAQGKDTGTVNLLRNNCTVKVEIGKRVKWDQAKLLAALDGMKPEDAKHYAKVTLEVSETKFKAAPPDVQAALIGARTVETEKPKFTFTLAEKDAA